MMVTQHSGDTIVTIDAENVDCFLKHLLRLDTETRLQRFCFPASDADLRDYVGRLDLQRTKVIGFICKGAMRGAAELSPSDQARALVLDAAISVEKEWQGRGIRSALVLRAIPVARGLGASHLRVAGLAANERLRRVVGQFQVDMLFEDDDCEAWLPVGRLGAAAVEGPAPVVHGLAFPSS